MFPCRSAAGIFPVTPTQTPTLEGPEDYCGRKLPCDRRGVKGSDTGSGRPRPASQFALKWLDRRRRRECAGMADDFGGQFVREFAGADRG